MFTRQLADAGINVQMIVVDWATLLKMRGQAEQWDIFVTHYTFSPDPILFTFLNATVSRSVEQPRDPDAADRTDRHVRPGRAQGDVGQDPGPDLPTGSGR